MACIVPKHIDKDEKEIVTISVVREKEWIQHNKNLWQDPNIRHEEENQYNLDERKSVDDITLEESESALNSMKSRKALGMGGINIELIKYGGIILKQRVLHLLNMCWKQQEIPKEWFLVKVKRLFKKMR